jgi:hypothetical protein
MDVAVLNLKLMILENLRLFITIPSSRPCDHASIRSNFDRRIYALNPQIPISLMAVTPPSNSCT